MIKNPRLTANNSKLGISLIAVLMFMLAATTASIVIFRMLGSENFSSGARLKQSEAYMAAESGVEAVQAWLSNKGADVGGLATEYFNMAEDERTINITNVLGLMRSSGDNRQNFSVYLMGIERMGNSSSHKFKFLSVGRARDNSEVKLAAFFDVSGLYQMNVPTGVRYIEKLPTNLPGYFGGSVSFSGSHTFSSATINGDFQGNPATVEKDFIVTGNFKNSGSGVEVGGTMCVGGDYDPNNDKVKVGDAYFGSSKNFLGTYENVYSAGDMKMMHTGNGVTINGNLTINGQLEFNGGASYPVKGDLYIGYDTNYIDKKNDCKDAYVNASGIGSGKTFSVCGNVWSCNPSGVKANKTEGARIRFNSGIKAQNDCVKNEKDTLSFRGAASIKDTNVTHETVPGSPGPSDRTGFFYSYASANSYINTMPKAASAVKDYCNDIWRPTTSNDCQTAAYVVDDPIVSALDSIKKFLNENKDDNTTVNGFKCLSEDIRGVGSNGNVTGITGGSGEERKITYLLNKCYESVYMNDKNRLYNGYLIVKLNQTEDYSNNTQLDGKFILIYPEQKENLFLAPTTNTSKVMVFLEKGAAKEVKSNGCTPADAKYNYFIYSLKNIGELNSWNEKCPLTGNIYFPSESCAKIERVNNNFKLEENADLVDDLMEAGILHSNSGGGECINCENSMTVIDFGQEKKWLAVSSRLKVSLSSKNISRETEPNTENNGIKSSVLVMPRVIRLTKDAFTNVSGTVTERLSNFYTFMYLNGATPKNNTQLPNFCKDISDGATNLKSSESGFIDEGFFKCTFADSTYSDFYVIVKGETGGATIKLSGDQQIPSDAGAVACRQMSVIVSENQKDFDFTLDTTANGSGWTINATGVTGCTIIPPSSSNNGAGNYKISCDDRLGNGSISFNVCSSSEKDVSVIFNILSENGITAVNPTESSIYREVPQMTIERVNLSGDGKVYCPDNMKNNGWFKLLTCPDGSTPITITDSKLWSCPLSSDTKAEYEIDISKAVGCELPIDIETKGSVNIGSNKAESFGLDLLWKSYTVTVKDGKVRFSTTNTNIPENERSSNDGSDVNSFKVYHGAEYTISVSDVPKQANFSDSLGCSNYNPVYFTSNMESTTIKPTGNGTITLSGISNPTAVCEVFKEQVRIGSGTLLSEIMSVYNIVGYECDVSPWPIIEYTIKEKIYSSDYDISNSTNDISNSTKLDSGQYYTIDATITCGERISSTPCGQFKLVGEADPEVSCAWGKSSYAVGDKPTATVTITTDSRATECKAPTVENIENKLTNSTNSFNVSNTSQTNASGVNIYKYTVTVNNALTDNDKGDGKYIKIETECTGNKTGTYQGTCPDVEITEKPPCEYEPEWCGGADFTNTTNIWSSNAKTDGCYFVSSINKFQGSIKINGKNFNTTCGQSGWSTNENKACAEYIASANIETADGGYYIYQTSGKSNTTMSNGPALSNDCIVPKAECNTKNKFDFGPVRFVGDPTSGNRPTLDIVTCSDGSSPTSIDHTINDLPPVNTSGSTLIKEDGGVYRVKVGKCDSKTPSNAYDWINCGTLVVKSPPRINECNTNPMENAVTLPTKPTQPTITLTDNDNVCSDANSYTPNNQATITWIYTKDGSSYLSSNNWNNIFNQAATYNIKDVSIKCGDYHTDLTSTCDGSVEVSGSGVQEIRKDEPQIIDPNGGSITIKCNSNDCKDYGALFCCRIGDNKEYKFLVNGIEQTINQYERVCDEFGGSFGGSAKNGAEFTIVNNGNLEMKCKFDGN